MTHGTTWLAIVDSEHARFVGHDQTGFHTVRMLTSETAGKRSSDLVSEGLGRTFESATIARHAIEPRTDPRENARQKFAKTIAQELNEAAAQGLFERLVLVAPPRVLGLVDAELASDVRRQTSARVHKDLVKTPDEDLALHFPAWPVVE